MGDISTEFFNKWNFTKISEAFSALDKILCIDLTTNEEGDLLLEILNNQVDEVIHMSDIIIIESFYIEVDGEVQTTLNINKHEFELHVVCSCWGINDNGNRANGGEMYARHGGPHQGWWYQQRRHHLCHHIVFNSDLLKERVAYTLVYVKNKILI